MANTFKVKTNAAMPASAGTPLTIYTVPSSTTSVVLGLVLCNVHTSQVTVDVQLVSDTSDTETNETVKLLDNAPIPALINGSLPVTKPVNAPTPAPTKSGFIIYPLLIV